MEWRSPKTSGSKGLQVYVPLDGRAGYGETKRSRTRWRCSSSALARVAEAGDLFAPVLSLPQRLPDASVLERRRTR